MPARKHPQDYAQLGPKDFWHSYSLQGLPPGRFVEVVQKIIAGRNSMVSTRSKQSAEAHGEMRTISSTD